MALRFIDSFDHYTTDDDITRKWSNTGIVSSMSIVSSPVRTGIGALFFAFTSGFVEKTIDSQQDWIVGVAFQVKSTLPTTDIPIIEFYDSGTVQVRLVIGGSGILKIQRGTTNLTDGESILNITPNTWYYIEFKAQISDSIDADSCIVRVNGVEWINVATSQDTKVTANATSDVIRFPASETGRSFYYDDLYICDDSGSKNNDFLGDVKVVALFPDGNGNSSDFDGSDGNQVDNFEMVDEVTPDDDTTYIESSTVGHIDLHTFDDLPETPDTIFGVQLNTLVKKDDAGTRTIRAVARPTSVDKFGTGKSPSNGSYRGEQEIWEDDPQATAAWTESTLNATEFGIEIET